MSPLLPLDLALKLLVNRNLIVFWPIVNEVIKQDLVLFRASGLPDENICLSGRVHEEKLVENGYDQEDQRGNHQFNIIIADIDVDPSNIAQKLGPNPEGKNVRDVLF